VQWTSQLLGKLESLESVTWTGTQLVAVGGGGTIMASTSDPPALPDYSAWIAAHPSVGDLAAHADTDHDGMTSLLEFALGTQPDNAASRLVPKSHTDATGLLTLTVAKPPNVDLSKVTYQAESSSNLIDWNSANITIVADTPAEYVARDNLVEGRRFLRLKVTLEP
jgi:hypothetical protein